MVRAESNDGTVRYDRGYNGRYARGAVSSLPARSRMKAVAAAAAVPSSMARAESNDGNDGTVRYDRGDDGRCACDDDDGDVRGMSELELKRMRNETRNNARLASLGLLVPMTSATTLTSDLSNRKKRLASQDKVERRVQPKCNAKQPTSYRDFNDDNDDDGDELDSNTIDSVFLSDEDGDLNDDDNNSHNELDIDTNDSELHSNEDGDEASKKSTILFTNNNSDGPKVFVAVLNNNDLKPSVRRTHLCLTMWRRKRKRRRRRRRSLRSIIRSIIQPMKRRA